MNTTRVTAGHAALAIDSGDTSTQGSLIVHGVAIGEGDVTLGGSRKQTLWPREVLQDAAGDLEGQPLATSKNHDAKDVKPQTPSDAVIGEVTWSGYKPGVGVLYEAEVDDPDIARSIRNGRLEVSPLVSRDVEPLEDPDADADFVATEIHRWRDLATVVDGAAPSNEIAPGTSPMKAEALHTAVETLQEGPSLDDPVDVPERVQNAAQAALDADEEGLIPDSCGTGVGTARAEQLASGEVTVGDMLTRRNDRTPIPSYLNSHEEDATTDDPPTDWGEEQWQSCGNAGLARWGWYADWARQTANELSEQRGEEAPYESMGYDSLQLETAREPTFEGTETSEDQPWGDVSKDLQDVTDAVGIDAETVDDLSAEQRQAIAEHTLLGDPEADTFSELFFFPVVNPDTDRLNEGALNAVRGGRGQSADIPQQALASADDMAAELLAEEFEGYEMDNGELLSPSETESMADVSDVSEDTLVRWNSAGERDAFGRVVDVREEGDEPLDGEIDGDQTINPPAALIEVHRPMDGEFEATDTMVGHTLNTDTLEVIDSLPDPENLSADVATPESLAGYMGDGEDENEDEDENKDEDEEEEAMQEVPAEFRFDNPGEAMEKAQEMGFEEIHTHGEGEDTVFMPGPSHEELMNAIGGDDGSESMSQSTSVADALNRLMDEITDDELAVLQEARELDDPTVVEADEYEALHDRVSEVRDVMEEALQDRTDLSDAVVSDLSFEALASEFEDDDGALQVDALAQSPETGTTSADGVEALNDADVEKAEALYADYQTFGNETLKNDIVDTLGVSDWDAATEVLE